MTLCTEILRVFQEHLKNDTSANPHKVVFEIVVQSVPDETLYGDNFSYKVKKKLVNAYIKRNLDLFMTQQLLIQPASLNYNIILVFMPCCFRIQIVTGIFLVMFYCSNAY